MSFESYTNCILRAFRAHPKPTEVVKRKQEILAGVAGHHNFTPDSVLYIGFNPAIMSDTASTIAVTCISPECEEYLHDHGIRFIHIPFNKLSDYHKKFESVVALDEFFTFAASDTEQKELVEQICKLAKEYVITTCKDYKNQEFKDREFSIPALIRGSQFNSVFLEFHDHDHHDRNVWKTEVYEIQNRVLNTTGPFTRRSMFFKQLAKFSADAGAVGFSVHKNLMYKSLIKKNYEHVISIRFENGS